MCSAEREEALHALADHLLQGPALKRQAWSACECNKLQAQTWYHACPPALARLPLCMQTPHRSNNPSCPCLRAASLCCRRQQQHLT
jgi:hypothetical protein